MKTTLLTALTLALVFVAGCDKNKDNGFSDAPPADAAFDDASNFEPVQVTDPGYTEPVFVDPAPAAAPAGGNSYTIRKGDTLWSIAKRHYGNGQRWQDIAAANPGLVPTKLIVGQTITLP